MRCLLLAVALGFVGASALPADVLLFETYSSEGALVGQSGWVQVGAETANPMNVAGGLLRVGKTGQDAAKPLTSPVASGAVFVGFDLNVSAAQSGDFFLAFSPGADGGGVLTDRLFVQASADKAGYLLGIASAIVPVYGTRVLELNHTYRVVTVFRSGTAAAIYVDPASPKEEGANASYLELPTRNTFADGSGYRSLAIVQNVSAKAPTLTLGNLVVATSFAEAAAMPKNAPGENHP